jgi:osmotically-inducible protein OsmY
MSETADLDRNSQNVAAVRAALGRSLAAGQLRLDALALAPDGALVIEGETQTLAAKKRALRIAAIAGGAAGLVDRLHVRRPSVMTDGENRTAVGERLALDPRFQDLSIEEDRDPRPLAEAYRPVVAPPAEARGRIGISVDDGVVTLDGRVPGLVRKRLAGAIAWRVAGVRDVVNGLAVEPPEQDGPDQLEEAIREVLDGHPLFDDAQVKVGVFGDVVRLTGLVHSPEARQAAEDAVWTVLGVDEVVNEIEARTAL